MIKLEVFVISSIHDRSRGEMTRLLTLDRSLQWGGSGEVISPRLGRLRPSTDP